MARKFLIMLLVAASCLRAIGPVFAQERIRIAWAGASPANAAIWVLQEKKLLQKYGVEPEIISISASPIVLQALLAGESTSPRLQSPLSLARVLPEPIPL